MVGSWKSTLFMDGMFSGAMLVLGRVCAISITKFGKKQASSNSTESVRNM